MVSEFKGMDIISINDFTKGQIIKVLDYAEDLEKNPKPKICDGKVLATLFFEPSTRTRLSFVSSMQRLGGSVLGFEDIASSSVSKGETLWDTIKMVENYADVIVMRHNIEGAARLASEASRVPVINAGDGANQHPTQTFLDLYTIKKELGKLEGLNVGFVGDLKYGRTVHSLCAALKHFNSKIYFIAPKELQMPKDYLDELDKFGIKYEVTSDLQKVASELDVIYVTRIQKERFTDLIEYNKLKGIYKIDKKFGELIRKNSIVMHPLPRVDEITKDFDDLPQAAYFRQAANGLYVREALIALTLGLI